MTHLLNTPIGRAMCWCSMAVFAESAPIIAVWILAVANSVPAGEAIMKLIGGVGPVAIGFGILIAAVTDIAIEERKLSYLAVHFFEFLILFGIIWWALHDHMIKNDHPDPVTFGLMVFIALVTVVVAGGRKMNHWHRHRRPVA